MKQGADNPVEPYERMYLMRGEPEARYTYSPADSIASLARAAGVTPIEAYIDLLDEVAARCGQREDLD